MATAVHTLLTGLFAEFQAARAELTACQAQRDALIAENAKLCAELSRVGGQSDVEAAADGVAGGEGVDAIGVGPALAGVNVVPTPIAEPPPAGSWQRAWGAALPRHIAKDVCRACVSMASRIARGGLDEHRPHHGFTFIVGDAHALEDFGSIGFNPFQHHVLSVIDANGALDEDTFEVLRRHAFTDGAILVDGVTGLVAAAGWFVSDVGREGTVVGGARTRAARAIAQKAGGCFVIKCSEDSTGDLTLHLGDRTQRLAAREDVRTPAVTAAAKPGSRWRSSGSCVVRRWPLRKGQRRVATGGARRAGARA